MSDVIDANKTGAIPLWMVFSHEFKQRRSNQLSCLTFTHRSALMADLANLYLGPVLCLHALFLRCWRKTKYENFSVFRFPMMKLNPVAANAFDLFRRVPVNERQ